MSVIQKFPIPVNDDTANHLKNLNIPSISLPNQEGNYLRLDRSDTFRMIIYFFPMTGRPDMPLPHNWNKIPGANGCTLQTCKFRDNYDDLISLWAGGLNFIPNVDYSYDGVMRSFEQSLHRLAASKVDICN